MRETREETGLTLTDYRYRGIVTFVSDRWPTEYMHLFTATGFTRAAEGVRRGRAGVGGKDPPCGADAVGGGQNLFRLLEQNVPFFSLKLVYEGERLALAVLDGKPL